MGFNSGFKGLNRISSLAFDVCLSAALLCTRGVNRSDMNSLAGRYSSEILDFHSSVAGDLSIVGILQCRLANSDVSKERNAFVLRG